MNRVKFDLELFSALNREYAKQPAAPKSTAASIAARAEKRTRRLDKLFDIRGKRVLDVGCGRGAVAHELAKTYGCHVTGVDIEEYPEWSQQSHPRLSLRKLDISQAHDLPLHSFDVIYSWSVMEHVAHPFQMLKTCAELLAPRGRFFLVAHLYRSVTGSHRTGSVFFPWPHLLFTDDVFEAFCVQSGRPARGPAWLNKLTYADYFRYFELLGYVVEEEVVRKRELDAAFYERFSAELSKYSIFDLTTNAVEVVLSVDAAAARKPGEIHRLVRRKFIDRAKRSNLGASRVSGARARLKQRARAALGALRKTWVNAKTKR
jgi:ubiquinone/menaquinone biosynthesis C-methylase UbiE